jgi:hypothetical protein
LLSFNKIFVTKIFILVMLQSNDLGNGVWGAKRPKRLPLFLSQFLMKHPIPMEIPIKVKLENEMTFVTHPQAAVSFDYASSVNRLLVGQAIHS